MIDFVISLVVFGGLFGSFLFVWIIAVALKEVITDRRRKRILREKDDA